jgi:N-acetylmuramoyl-L-alanine amidase
LGNIQNAHDQKRLVIADNRQALANWITAGIIADYKEKK